MIEKYYGIRYDSSFKNVFSKEEFLILFFRDIFHEKVDNITYIDKEMFQENINLSYSICDLLIETKNEIIIFEMQNQDLKNLEARLTMYQSKIYYLQNPGKDYKDVKPVKIRVIINYSYKEEKTLKEYQQLEKEILERFGEYFDIKIWNLKEALKDRNKIDYKYALLFTLDEYSLEDGEMILNILGREEKFKKLVQTIKLYNTDLENYQRLKKEEESQMTLEDVARAYAEEAREIEKLETAKNLLKQGIDIRIIMEVTKLSEDQIQQCQTL